MQSYTNWRATGHKVTCTELWVGARAPQAGHRYSQIVRSCHSSPSWHSRRPPGWGWLAAAAAPTRPRREPGGAVKAAQQLGLPNLLCQAAEDGGRAVSTHPWCQERKLADGLWSRQPWPGLCHSGATFPPGLWKPSLVRTYFPRPPNPCP